MADSFGPKSLEHLQPEPPGAFGIPQSISSSAEARLSG